MIGYRVRQIRESLSKEGKKISQESFGKEMGVTRSVIANIEYGKVEPTEMFLQLLCTKYNVNEEWLRTGEGEPFIKLTKDEELMEWAGKVLSTDSESFQKRFVSMLSRLNESEWQVLEKMAIELTENKKD